MRTLVWFLIFLGLFNLAGALAKGHRNGMSLALAANALGAYSIVALATACGLTENKAILVATVVVVLLVCFPCDLHRLSTALTPVGVGLLLGMALRRTLPERENGDTR